MRGDETIMDNNCPVCFSPLKMARDYEEHILLEEHAKCEDEHHYYTYTFAYGNTSETIGGVTITGHHSDSKELRSLRTKQFNAVAELERKNYLAKRKIADVSNPDIESIFTVDGEIINHQTITGFNVYVPTQEISFTIPRVMFTLGQWRKLKDGMGTPMSLAIIDGKDTTIKSFRGGVTAYDTPEILDSRTVVERVVILGHLSTGHIND